MKKFNLLLCLIAVISISFISGCSNDKQTTNKSSVSDNNQSSSDSSDADDSDTFTIHTDQADIEAKFSSFDQTTSYSNETKISLSSDKISVDGDGAIVSDNNVVISNEGHYLITGKLNDGQIIVDASIEENVHIILDNADITCSDSSPIYIKNCNKTVITLQKDSINQLTDGTTYEYDDAIEEEPNACIFSKDDLSINGEGSLIVKSNFYNGISSKDDLKILSGKITVNAVNNGLRGKDSVVIKSGTINITSGKDGIKSSNDTDIYKGYIYMESGTVEINAGSNGLQAVNAIKVIDGKITITSTKEAVNCVGNVDIAEGCLN